ncbi:MAG: NAD-binding oxidoreductase, partial [Burkholderiales bacterium]
MRLFSYRDRPVHLGPYPLERLPRADRKPDLARVPPMQPLRFEDRARPESLVNAMARYIGMFDVVRDGTVARHPAEIPDDALERSNHLKAAGYYFDASMVGICALPPAARLVEPIGNPIVAEIAAELETSQPKSFAAGMDMILADVIESARKKLGPIDDHTHAIVFLVEYPREPRPDEPGTEWIVGTQAHRAAVLAAQTAVLLSTYLRMLGFEARSHTATCSDVDLGRLAVAAGLTKIPAGDGARMPT